MKVKIECSENELYLINKALDFYSRVGTGQMIEIVKHPTFEKTAKRLSTTETKDIDWNKYHEMNTRFNFMLCHERDKFTQENHGTTGNWGIFNKNIDKSCVISYDLYQSIRYALYGTVDAYPPDACKIANLPIPEFKIEIT